MINFQPEPEVVVASAAAGYELYAEDFRLVAEILSPSNTRRDIELNLRRYREAPDNLYVVVIMPRRFLAEVYAMSRNWQPAILAAADVTVEIPEFGQRCLLGELYRRTPLNPQTTGA